MLELHNVSRHMRGYQHDFITKSKAVTDPRSRARKASKVLEVLARHTTQALSTFVALDVGCSSGMLTSYLAPHFKSIVGLEFDTLSIFSATSDVRRKVKLVQGDGLFLPFKDGSFDLVICAQVYEHVPDDRLMAVEIRRVLREGGIVFFSGPNWLFPIEPHYYIPFLHWLPPEVANKLLHVLGHSEPYYERSRHYWGLKQLWADFVIVDATPDVLAWRWSEVSWLRRLVLATPRVLWKAIQPFVPNFNWVLLKKRAPQA